ncbi:MAG: HD domain-containing protein, partial [Emcibacteraceae bacterium]|nr:HD domain-containing protein [Emcibacteraceae bacterium]
NNAIEQSWENLNPTQAAALKVSLKVFEDTFDSLKNGGPLPDKEIRESCDLLIKATAGAGIGDMLSAIRTHHNYTYRHSIMVSGYLVAFALLLGIKGQDLQNVAVGGILHDIGKSLIPAEILNKPKALNNEEWLEMCKHPEHSRTILENSTCHKDVINASIQHHEKLDGTGYPDGLKGDQISDIARMVAIADVFSGLTEKRSYKDSFSNKKAYDIMLTMDGHLDLDLVAAFRPIALQ